MMDEQGYGTKEEIREIAENIWATCSLFGLYGFPKAHSTSYSLIANATQYLKIHYPKEFFCSYLQQANDDEYIKIKNVAKNKYKVKFLNPEINTSKNKFIIKNDKIVWSFNSIKGIGVKAADELTSKQPFYSLKDFFDRINKRVVNVRVGKVLIAANVFRKFGKRNKIIKEYLKLRKDKDEIIKTKEEWFVEAVNVMPYIQKSIKRIYKDKMGKVISLTEFHDLNDGRRAVVAGIINSIKKINTKRGEMFIVRLSDVGESYTIICWNDMVKKLNKKSITLEVGVPIKASGIKDSSYRDEPQIIMGSENSSYIKLL